MRAWSHIELLGRVAPTGRALRLSPIYRWVYETAGTESWVSIERIEDRLGYAPRFSNREALIRNYRWYLEHRAKRRTSYGISHRAHWRQGMLRLLKAFF